MPDSLQAAVQQPMGVDWQAIHRRLEATQAAIEHGIKPTPEAERALLKARAQALAQEPGPGEAPEAIEVVEFLLGPETYGVPASYIREVYPLKELTPLPCTPAFVLGIINVRGQILSVIDLKHFFGLPYKGFNRLSKVIILHDRAMVFGILADAVVGARSIPLDTIQPSLPTLTGVRAAYLRGVTSDQMVILDAGALLSDRQVIVLEEVEGYSP